MEQIAVFGGGCFWCLDAAFRRLRGVTQVTAGYAGGTTANPTYEEVCSGDSGHAEVIHVTFEPTQITYDDLLTVFFAMHDPTTLNQQGSDIGEQYRSIIFPTTDEQHAAAERFIARLANERVFTKPIVTQVESLTNFFAAEDHHQRYYDRNREQGYCSVVISPKLKKLRERFAEILRDGET